jgi:hypothetical protein
MTDRYKGFSVTLIKDMRDDDAESLLDALKMLKGVLKVTPVLADPIEDSITRTRTVTELQNDILQVFKKHSTKS